MKRILRLMLCAMLVCAMPLVICADSGYSTEDDPLITLSYIQKVLKAELKQEILEELSVDDLTEELRAALEAELRVKLTKELKAELTESIKKDLTATLTKELTKTLTAQVGQALREELVEEIRAEVEEGLTESIAAELTERLTEELTASITESVRADLTESLTAEIGAKLESEMLVKLDAAISQILAEKLYNIGEYEEVRVQPGTVIQARGPVELIITRGIASAMLPETFVPGVGVYDITDGRRLLPEEEVLQGHAILMTGHEGVAVKITHTEAIVMIRGEYSIVQQNG